MAGEAASLEDRIPPEDLLGVSTDCKSKRSTDTHSVLC